MAFRILLRGVARDPVETLKARLEAALGPQIGEHLDREHDQACNRLLDGAAHRTAIPAALVLRVKDAEHAARVSALAYEERNRRTTRAEVHGNDGEIAAARNEETAALERARKFEKAALDARRQAKAELHPQHVEHVEPLFWMLIAAALASAVKRVAAGELHDTNTADFEFSGHVEDAGISARWRLEITKPGPPPQVIVYGHDSTDCEECVAVKKYAEQVYGEGAGGGVCGAAWRNRWGNAAVPVVR